MKMTIPLIWDMGQWSGNKTKKGLVIHVDTDHSDDSDSTGGKNRKNKHE